MDDNLKGGRKTFLHLGGGLSVIQGSNDGCHRPWF